MRECKGVLWGFSWLGATCWRFCRKTQKEPAKCLYSVLYTLYSVLLSPLWLKSVPGWPAISVSTWQQPRVGQKVWFGCLSAISQLASREGEGGGVRQLCLHSVTQPFTTWPRWREQGGGLCFLPLVKTYRMSLISARSILLDSTFYSWTVICCKMCNLDSKSAKYWDFWIFFHIPFLKHSIHYVSSIMLDFFGHAYIF